MKTCIACGNEKSLAEFVSDNRAKDGKAGRCLKCHNAKNVSWRGANVEKDKASKKKWADANPEKVKAKNKRLWRKNSVKEAQRSARWRKNNQDLYRQIVKDSSKKNQAYRTALQTARKARQLRATPGWANKVAIGEYYAFAAIKTRMTGEPWQVDHKVPLRSKKVCGLHTDYNLQVIRGVENSSKGNRTWPDMQV